MNTSAGRGGAERVVSNLHERYRALGYETHVLVGRGPAGTAGTRFLAQDAGRSPWARAVLGVGKRLPARSDGRPSIASKLARWGAEPHRRFDVWRGHEDFAFPSTRDVVLKLVTQKPSVLHCHNLHGDYFDLTLLPELANACPTLLTLHDAWLLSGHCSHSFDCGRWETGCGRCPDLTIYPALPRDATAFNWNRKSEIFARAGLFVTTPSRWLMERVERSLIAPSILASRVIPNGVDLSVFRPGDKAAARAKLSIPGDATVLLFVGNLEHGDRWRDASALEQVARRLEARMGDKRVMLIKLGERSTTAGEAVERRAYEDDQTLVADHYRAADVYLHPALADTFPNTVLEALGCGTPVVATSVGGIPEQVRSLALPGERGTQGTVSLDRATGILVGTGGVDALIAAVERIITEPETRRALAENAVRDARARFALDDQIEAYLGWYDEITARWLSARAPVDTLG